MPKFIPKTALLCAAVLLIGCGSDASGPSAPQGPPNGIIDIDYGSIPLGEGGAGAGGAGAGNHAGSGASSAGQGHGGANTGTGGSSGGSSLPPAHGVSAPCELDSDCTMPLSCHFDTEDYIADQQCTSSCDSDEQCEGALGKSSFCIGAHVCVHACKTDADCLAKTHCNNAGWCERGGPGSGLPYCGGTATPCYALSGTSCTASLGCTDTSECGGFASSCYSQFDSYSCTSQQGCYWSSSSKSCSGSARSCSSMYGSLSCNSQEGCFWSGGCTGTAESCSEQFVSLCSNQPGCSLRTD